MKAYCYASGLIKFGYRVPDGAVVIAEGKPKALKAFIGSVARHGYRTEMVKGRPTKIAGSDTLLVPGVPEAPNQSAGMTALIKFCGWASKGAASDGIKMNGPL